MLRDFLRFPFRMTQFYDVNIHRPLNALIRAAKRAVFRVFCCSGSDDGATTDDSELTEEERRAKQQHDFQRHKRDVCRQSYISVSRLDFSVCLCVMRVVAV